MIWDFYKWGFWMRFWGNSAGFAVDWKAPMLFSERNGYRSAYRIGPIRIEWLEPD